MNGVADLIYIDSEKNTLSRGRTLFYNSIIKQSIYRYIFYRIFRTIVYNSTFFFSFQVTTTVFVRVRRFAVIERPFD